MSYLPETTSAHNPLLEKIASTIGELPASPAIVSAVMGLTVDLNANIEELGKVLAADQALTVKVLRLSNSSFYGRSKSVSTLKEAILVLGFYTLRSMVIATSTYSLYRKKKGDTLSLQKLWDHSLACAMACRLVGNRIHHPKIEEVFIVGLLHDIGKMVLGQKMGEVYRRVIYEVESTQKSFAEIETEKFGFDHAELGLAILNKWNFPEELARGVYQHHNSLADLHDDEPVPIGVVVNFSNQLSKKIGVGYRDQYDAELSKLPLAERFDLTDSTIDELIEELRTHYFDEKKLFEEN